MNGEQYKEILKNNLQESYDLLKIKNPILIHGRDPSHISKVAQNWLKDNKFKHILIPGSKYSS